jgi:hypothetical protein
MVVFVVKPSGWMTPVDENNLPQFSYVHKPAGSPDEGDRTHRVTAEHGEFSFVQSW